MNSRGHFYIRDEVFHLDLSAHDISVYAAMCALADDDGLIVHERQSDIAKVAGVSDRQAGRCIKNLRNVNLVEVTGSDLGCYTYRTVGVSKNICEPEVNT